MINIFNKVLSIFLSLIMTIGGVATADVASVFNSLESIGTSVEKEDENSPDTSADVQSVEETAAEIEDLTDIIAEYDTGKPVTYSFDIEDDLTRDEGTYKISMEQYKKITGDTCSISGTDDGILIQHDDYSVALNEDESMMYVNDDEYNYISSSLTNENNKFYFPLEDVAEGLGYTVTENGSEITLTRDYQSERILVKTTGELKDTQGAAATAVVTDDLYALQYESEIEAKDACKYFDTLEGVEFAEPDYIVSVEEVEQETQSKETYYSWGADAMGVADYTDYLENIGTDNLNDVIIAVLDSGIDTDHPWFSGRIAENGANYSTSTSQTDYAYEDVYGHGTHVSGIICDLTLDNVKILPIKILNDRGIGKTSLIIQGIYYAIKQKQDGQNIYAINMSLGAAGADADKCSAYKEAITDAYNAGILTVAAAGNDGGNANAVAPANTECAITVAAVGQSDAGYYRPSWSNYGPNIDLSAPGYKIESACVGGGTVLKSGTSMAAPHVAAAIALLYSNSSKTYTLTQIEDALDYYAVDLGNTGWDQYYGMGMADLEYAYVESIDAVTFSNTTSECTSAFDLSLSCPVPDAKIYYTLDGSKPSFSNGTLYTDAINISSSARVKAVAYVLDSENKITKLSRISAITYCFDGQDVANAFTVSSEGTLTSYTGILTVVNVPSSINGVTVTSIGENAFSTVTATVISVTLPSTVVSLNDYAFYNCRAMTEVYAPGVTSIGKYAFCHCFSFKYLQDEYFPELLTIDDYAFLQSYGLHSVDLQNAVSIGNGAFSGCVGLTNLYLLKAETLAASIFDGCSADLTLFVHKDSTAQRYAVSYSLKYIVIESLTSACNTTVIDNGNHFVYGLASGIKSLDGYISTPDTCDITYTPTSHGFGTGTAVNIIQNGVTLCSYSVVIFGDIDGDGQYNGCDAVIASLLANGLLTENDVSSAAYTAADANHDGIVDAADTDLLNQAGLYMKTVGQK